MSLERKDVRAKLDPELHGALNVICERDGLTQADWIESVIAPLLRKEIQDTVKTYDAFLRAGIIGSDRE